LRKRILGLVLLYGHRSEEHDVIERSI